jgi:predicted nucleic acid-binding protein
VSSAPIAPTAKALVLDANILVRAVLGTRVLPLMESYSGRVDFLSPEVAFADLHSHLPNILRRRGLSAETVEQLLENEILGRLPRIVTPVAQEVYAHLEIEARRRLARRDEADWPYVALALNLGCPVWTEDQDFFGSGIAIWTTDRVEIYLGSDQ